MLVTLNNERTLPECLLRIRQQDYPKSLVEKIAIDAGSSDNTRSMLSKFGFTIIDSPVGKNAESQRSVGIARAKHNIIVSIDADNYLPHKRWLRRMVQPFMDDPSVVHSGTMYYTYRKNDTMVNRYCALFGLADPIVYYVGKPDRLPHFIKRWTLGNVTAETKDYYLVDFSPDTLPTVGCNGVAYRRDVLLKHAASKPEQFFHIDVFADLVNKGYVRFAVVKNSVIHDTAASLTTLMQKRIAYMARYYLRSTSVRRYLIYDPSKPEDRRKLLLFIIYTVTIVRPFLDALRGFMVIADVAWFLHPVMCWIYMCAYGIAALRRETAKIRV